MKDKVIKVADNSMVYFDDKVLGIDVENQKYTYEATNEKTEEIEEVG